MASPPLFQLRTGAQKSLCEGRWNPLRLCRHPRRRSRHRLLSSRRHLCRGHPQFHLTRPARQPLAGKTKRRRFHTVKRTRCRTTQTKHPPLYLLHLVRLLFPLPHQPTVDQQLLLQSPQPPTLRLAVLPSRHLTARTSLPSPFLLHSRCRRPRHRGSPAAKMLAPAS